MSLFVETIEIDVPYCAETYGVGNCTAEVGVTGERKCTNCPADCQDLPNFNPQDKTFRIVVSSEGHMQTEDIEAFPHLKRVEVNAQRINPGNDLGRRERITATCTNGPDDDSFFDKYGDERTFNPYEQGTLMGRFTARWPNVQGYPFRHIFGYADEPYSQRVTHHYIAHSARLSATGQELTFEAKDALSVIDGKKFLYPTPSDAILNAGIGTGGVTFAVIPTGIGGTLPASGFAAMGKEVVEYTRSGDDITIAAGDRGLYGSELTSHEAEETFQPIGRLNGTASEILNTLVTGKGIDEYANKPAWDNEIQAANRTLLYDGWVAEPTETGKLISELMRDVGLDIHTNVIDKKIEMNVIRRLPSSFSVGPENSFDVTPEESEADIINQVYLRYGRLNPLEKMDEDKNYRGKLFRIDSDQRYVLMGNTPSINAHYSRFIPLPARSAADDLAKLKIGRYHKALKTIAATFPFDAAPILGQVGEARSPYFEDQLGDSNEPIPVQVVRIATRKGTATALLSEYRIDATISSEQNIRPVAIDYNYKNINLRALYDATYSDAPPANSTVRFISGSGVVVGSDLTSEFSITDGSWPEIADGLTIELVEVIGLGRGGDGGGPNLDGLPGGPSLFTRTPLTCIDCYFGGGGGGGAGDQNTNASNIYNANGGGGAGSRPGTGFEDGTHYTGGAGENNDEFAIGGDGGDIGQPGFDAASTGGATGGSAGVAVDGFSYLTLTTTTVVGPTVN